MTDRYELIPTSRQRGSRPPQGVGGMRRRRRDMGRRIDTSRLARTVRHDRQPLAGGDFGRVPRDETFPTNRAIRPIFFIFFIFFIFYVMM